MTCVTGIAIWLEEQTDRIERLDSVRILRLDQSLTS